VTIATAIVFSHRFFLRQSHAKNDRRVCSPYMFFFTFVYVGFLVDMLYLCSSHSSVSSSCAVVFATLGIFVFINSPTYVRLLP
jgi:lipid-A-disaccharide synthase-like uncharacterized protein